VESIAKRSAVSEFTPIIFSNWGGPAGKVWFAIALPVSSCLPGRLYKRGHRSFGCVQSASVALQPIPTGDRSERNGPHNVPSMNLFDSLPGEEAYSVPILPRARKKLQLLLTTICWMMNER